MKYTLSKEDLEALVLKAVLARSKHLLDALAIANIVQDFLKERGEKTDKDLPKFKDIIGLFKESEE